MRSICVRFADSISKSKDPIAVIAWTEIFRRLEGCCDDFEDVSQEIEYVLMKKHIISLIYSPTIIDRGLHVPVSAVT